MATVHAQHPIGVIPYRVPLHHVFPDAPLREFEAQVERDLLEILCTVGRVRRELVYQSDSDNPDGPYWYRGFSTVLP